ncbi:MAG: hypothetical protein HGB26_05315 [Desulfobulbaceae bacterium]|nr:hypothetical protein [Desulfobulbaceae bacterium]
MAALEFLHIEGRLFDKINFNLALKLFMQESRYAHDTLTISTANIANAQRAATC